VGCIFSGCNYIPPTGRLDQILNLIFSGLGHYDMGDSTLSRTKQMRQLEKIVGTFTMFKGRLKGFNVYLWKNPEWQIPPDWQYNQPIHDALERQMSRTVMGEDHGKTAGDKRGMAQ
jgi:hypothetical protein